MSIFQHTVKRVVLAQSEILSISAVYNKTIFQYTVKWCYFCMVGCFMLISQVRTLFSNENRVVFSQPAMLSNFLSSEDHL